MLFDLQGKRRRVVQVVYLGLAILLGGGLVFFGIGGEVSGGLFDAFSDRSGSGSDNGLVEKRVDANEKKVKQSSRNSAARKALVRDYFTLAGSQTAQGQVQYPDNAKDELRNASRNWKAYLALEPDKPDTSLARVMLQVYDPAALNQPKEALSVARLIAENEEDSQAYLNLVQFAALAGDSRVADLAGLKAVDLAPKAERKQTRADVKQLKQQAEASKAAQGAQGPQGPQGAPTPAAPTAP